MQEIKVFSGITIVPPYQKIYRRLGYNPDITRVSGARKKETDQYIEEALSFLDLKGTSVILPIKENNGFQITLVSGIVFKSKNVAALVRDCQEMLVFAATAGEGIVAAIQENVAGKNITKSVVFDAVASEMVDGALAWIVEFLKQDLRRQNKVLIAKRFSAGYGDFSLKNQEIIYKILKLNTLGIRINEQCLLIPEKSVTAVSGVIAEKTGR